jgi:SNF2 family DNA or RNA helicase
VTVQTTIFVDMNEYRLQTDRFDYRWLAVTKMLPLRAWQKPFWVVPRHSIPLDILRDRYSSLGGVNIVDVGKQTDIDTVTRQYPFLYEFQSKAVVEIVNSGSYLLAHTMGLGKTLTSFAAALELRRLSGYKKNVLIICPASIQPQWKDEVQKWFGQEMLTIKGTKIKRGKLWKEPNSFKLISYESFRSDWSPELATTMTDTIVVADETSKIKNRSKISKVFQEMAKRVANRIGVTGTPLSSRLDNYWRIMQWVTQGRWMSYPFFESNYTIKDVIYVGGEPMEVIVGYRNLDDFVKRLKGYVDRKTKEEVAKHLPPRTVEWRRVEMTANQVKLEGRLMEYAETAEMGILPVWQLLHTLSDGTSVTLQSMSEVMRNIDTAGVTVEDSPKLQEIDSILEELGEDKKVIFYTQFSRFARAIQRHLNTKANKTVAALATGEDPDERDASVKKFREDPNTTYLVSTDTLAMGVSFPDIDYLINADINPDVSIMLQRMDRIHRINSTTPKLIVNLYSSGIEEDIYSIIRDKALLSEQVTEGKSIMKVDIQAEIERKYGLKRKKMEIDV